MASFISILSLFLLVLASGYYTAPVINETTSLSNEPGRETMEVPKYIPRSSFYVTEPEATSPEGTTEEHKSQGLRLVPNDDTVELSTPETHTQETREMPEMPDTLEFTTETTPGQHHSGSQNSGAESESAEEPGKEKSTPGKTFQRRGMLDESTTTTPIMPSHSTSSSTIVPEGHSASSTSTIKYTGLLKDDETQSTEGERPGKPNKSRPKPEEPTETLGAVMIDSQSVPDLGSGLDGVMRFDDNTIPSITDPSTTTMEGKPKPKPKPTETQLNEGEKSPQSEEEKQN